MASTGIEGPVPNLYDAIGVTADASADKIKRKTRKLMNEVRESDKRNREKNELIRFFKNARNTLCNADERKEYDTSIGIETICSDRGNATADEDAHDAHDAHDAYETSEPMVALGELTPFQPFGALGALGALGTLTTLGSPRPPPRSCDPRRATATATAAASSMMELLGSGIHDMFSDSIVPAELHMSSSSSGGLKPGTFQILEYTKVRNPGGGFDEFGFTRQGDIKHNRVTEKRFERKS